MTPPARAALAPAVVRIFGDNTDIIIDRAREIEAPALSPPHALHPPPPPAPPRAAFPSMGGVRRTVCRRRVALVLTDATR